MDAFTTVFIHAKKWAEPPTHPALYAMVETFYKRGEEESLYLSGRGRRDIALRQGQRSLFLKSQKLKFESHPNEIWERYQQT